ncbi:MULTISPECIES: DEAD/DEAH box helicase [Facklamia]|uniref:ATP-dependent RNA helicase CshA n=1 Tax=Facklamia hominis CCUG 36813 TaxID=883111 RepID=K1LRV8_9LACT|nr:MULTISPECIES: DEAD/DEAH box helicase [Facklamia]EKB54852.1 hypothetical protein HMPREF9706_01042 [Facklamia hominis CCUG 36813]OFL67685.1 RNA helicase [Facklamia sp. HMSC062C11]PKY93859.1 ATP-dependent helicase [Facklamia hominis]
MKFTDLNLKNELLTSLDELGFEEPTPIQQQGIPIALSGKDLIGQAQTGTGKTAAFGLPLLNKIDPKNTNVQALIVAPTRELAIQVQEELYRLSKVLKTNVYVVYGGAPIDKQIKRLRSQKVQVLVGTPGRLLDLLKRNVLKLNAVQTLVLDEADEMLNMGFIEDIKAIIQQAPETRQTLLFSATMPKAIKELAGQFLINAEHIKIKAQYLTTDLIEQYYTRCRDDEKFDILTRFIDVQNPKQAIVFCRTKKRVDEVGRGLNLRGYNAELIHGDITQQKRTSVIDAFRKGEVELLVATDVAARGLDISGVTHVYNYDITQDPESYVHRVGRTGRAGNEGMSLTFVQGNELGYLATIEKLIGKQMLPLKPPTQSEVRRGQVQQVIDDVNDILEKGNVDEFRQVAKLLLNHYQSNDLVSALLSQLLVENSHIEVEISPQRPLPNVRRFSNHKNASKNATSKRSHRSNNKNRGHSKKRNHKNFVMKKSK